MSHSQVFCSHSNFIGNKAEKQGAVLSFRYPISLSGINVFKRNEGGGVSLMQSRVDVSGTAYFIENSALSGGGLALEDQCLVYIYILGLIQGG